ncbi:inner membrane transporter yicL [Klebsiella pneumoniae]|uniref:Inner membrane transporter yicL n=1 Tax=Klebsiella pneumoniae TaxID=573 RepID=A0A4P0YII7_KLEPN|nr:inner membrane transporter yicL [Klebsiella pneumoniae]
MGSSKKGMLNVLIAAVLWGSSGCVRNLLCRKARCRRRF